MVCLTFTVDNGRQDVIECIELVVGHFLRTCLCVFFSFYLSSYVPANLFYHIDQHH
jgi:hypothetical protein